MNKRLCALSLVLAGTMIFGACKPGYENLVPDGKTEIKVSVYEGGFGKDWIQTLADEYNNTALKDTDYFITLYPDKILPDSVLSVLSGGADAPYQLYVNEGNEWGSGIYKDFFIDLSEIANSKVDGESGKTVKDKMRGYETWQGIYSKHGQGLYALPWGNSIMGMVIDHQLFIDREWYTFAGEAEKAALTEQGITFIEGTGVNADKLVFVSSTGTTNYKEGDVILTAGHDGTYGTYDDGQPVTLQEFDALIETIANDNIAPFIWGGAISSYLDALFNSVFAMYAGEEGYNAFHRYDSMGKELELSDGTKTVININNGYLVPQLKAIEKAYEFFKSHFDYKNPELDRYMHNACKGTSENHLDAQNLYLLGWKGDPNNQQSAILIDGNWWENEARSMFNELEYADRGRGDREYRYLLLPELEGSQTEKSVFSCTASGSIVVPKDKNAERLEYTKGFVKHMLKDESLRMVARTTGYNLSYEYTLTAEDEKDMTPFTKNVAQLYADTENIEIKYFPIDKASSPLSYASNKGIHNIFLPTIRNTFPQHVVDAIKNYSLAEIVEGLKGSYTKANWETYIQQAQDNGFFTD